MHRTFLLLHLYKRSSLHLVCCDGPHAELTRTGTNTTVMLFSAAAAAAAAGPGTAGGGGVDTVLPPFAWGRKHICHAVLSAKFFCMNSRFLASAELPEGKVGIRGSWLIPG